MYNMKDKRCKF